MLNTISSLLNNALKCNSKLTSRIIKQNVRLYQGRSGWDDNLSDNLGTNSGNNRNNDRVGGRSGGRSKNSYSSPYNDRGNNDNRRSSRSDSFRNNPGPNNYRSGGRNRDRDNYDDDFNSEPIYGRYDGDHIFGMQPVRAALKASKRKFKELIVQSGLELGNKKDDSLSDEIAHLALKHELEVKEYPKHDLNMMSGSRPHQGFILRAEPLKIDTITTLDKAEVIDITDDDGTNNKVPLVLALDEVVDPMNLGALLRSSYFLGCSKVIVCTKNSAPLSPVVSKASAGAMELINIESTTNMMKFLDKSKENGWKVIGTALNENTIPLNEAIFDSPTILVLGNEGHGMRKNVQNRCDELIKVDGGNNIIGDGTTDESSIDSLNVSVTGGILMHYILNYKK